MLTVENIIQADDKIFKIIEEDFPNAVALLTKSEIQKSGKALTLFLSKSNFIKNGIYDLLESKNLYACKILFRSLIEHYLKLHYMVFKVAGSNSDEVGEDYYLFSDLLEKIQMGDSYKKIALLLNPDREFENVYTIIKEMHPEVANYSNNFIKKKAFQFNYKEIIKYLYDEIFTKQNDKSSPENFLLNLIPEYSDLSSFVHGGPYADHLITSMKSIDDPKIENEIKKNFYFSVLLCGHMNCLFFMVAIKYDKKYSKTFALLHEQLFLLSSKDNEGT